MQKDYQFDSFLLVLAFLGIVAALLLSGCGPSNAAAPLETPVIAAGVMAASETPPTETATPQPTATATNVPDYSGLWPSQTAVAIRQQEIALTQSSLQLIGQANDLSNAAGNATATMRAVYTNTAQADVYATQTQMPVDAQATVSAKQTEIALDKAQKQAEQDVTMGYVKKSLLGLTGLVVLVIFGYGGWIVLYSLAKEQQPKPDPEYDTNELDNVPAQPKVPTFAYIDNSQEQGNAGYTVDRDTVPPGDPEKFSAFMFFYALGGGLLGINSVEGKAARADGTKIYTRAEYSPVLTWLHKKGYDAHDPSSGGAILSSDGKQFGNDWLADHPPLLPELSQNHARNAP